MRTYGVCVATLSLVAMLGACSDGSMNAQDADDGASVEGTPVTSAGVTDTGAGATTTSAGATTTGAGGMLGGLGGPGSTSMGDTSSGPTTGTGGSSFGGSASGPTTTTAGGSADVGIGGMQGSTGVTGGSDVGGMGGTSSTDGSMGTGGTGTVGPTGPFKVLILSTALEFPHDSIPTCQKMVADLGQVDPDPNNQWTTEIETDDLQHFTDEGLSQYGLLFWCNPTGTVFSNNGNVPKGSGPAKMQALQDYVEGGGAWAGVHSASDFEKTNGFPWFTNTLMGGYFQTHDNDGTPGSVRVESDYTSHPVAAGLSQTYSTQDEWYYMNRDVSAQPGFEIIQRLTSDNRPITWIKEVGAGRMFYTVRGHNKTVYAEEEFRTIVQNGIMWATKRTN